MNPAEKREEAEALGTTPEASASEAVRVVLDRMASLSYERMARILREEGSIRLPPSKFVSFLVTYFFSSYFEKDKELLLGEFFDSKAYVENELKKATDPSEVGAILEHVMLKVRRMQEIRKRGMRSAKARGGDSHG